MGIPKEACGRGTHRDAAHAPQLVHRVHLHHGHAVLLSQGEQLFLNVLLRVSGYVQRANAVHGKELEELFGSHYATSAVAQISVHFVLQTSMIHQKPGNEQTNTIMYFTIRSFLCQ